MKLYRARWQIELLFKRLKTGLHLYLVPVQVWERARAYVHLCLLVWALQEQETQALSWLLTALLQEPEVGPAVERAEAETEPAGWVLSQGKLARSTLETQRTMLRGSWTQQRVRDCLPALQRYLVSRHRSKRPSQYAEVQHWLRQQLATPEQQVALA